MIRRLLPLLALGCLTGCPTGFRLVRVEGERPSVYAEMWDYAHNHASRIPAEAEIDPVCEARSRPLFHCDAQKDLCQTPFDARIPIDATGKPDAPAKSQAETACKRLTSLMSFVQLSDAQLKEHNIHMDGPISEIAYDGLTNGALRHPLLERHDDAGLLATVVAINRLADAPALLHDVFAPCPAPVQPSFAIHTGDAVDSGMFSELAQFYAAVSSLRLPFFNLVGNHDNLFFGTFPPDQMKGLNVVIPFVPIVDTDRFMRFHNPAAAQNDLTLPSFTNQEAHVPTSSGIAFAPIKKKDPPGREVFDRGSNYLGFDYACSPGDNGGLLCPDARGYYSFDLPLRRDAATQAITTTLRVVVLNTAEIVPENVAEGFDRLSRANMQPAQLRWLVHELDRPATGELVTLVLGHHNLEAFLHEEQGLTIASMLRTRPNVLGYLSGHLHRDAFRVHPRPKGRPLWELVAGSLLVYPQFARMFDILEDPERNLYLRVASFRQQLGDDPDAIGPDAPRCRALGLRAGLQRTGASLDADSDRRDDHEAIPNANALLRVYDKPK
ncbi:MAG: metallophosphoesterase [Polyangiaceae bacterium]